jgi:hypothetical protein
MGMKSNNTRNTVLPTDKLSSGNYYNPNLCYLYESIQGSKKSKKLTDSIIRFSNDAYFKLLFFIMETASEKGAPPTVFITFLIKFWENIFVSNCDRFNDFLKNRGVFEECVIWKAKNPAGQSVSWFENYPIKYLVGTLKNVLFSPDTPWHDRDQSLSTEIYKGNLPSLKASIFSPWFYCGDNNSRINGSDIISELKQFGDSEHLSWKPAFGANGMFQTTGSLFKQFFNRLDLVELSSIEGIPFISDFRHRA